MHLMRIHLIRVKLLLIFVVRYIITMDISRIMRLSIYFFFFSSRRRHTRCSRDWEFRRVLFRSLAALSAAGVPTGVLVAPVIPALNDHEMEAILEAAAHAGVRWAGYVLLRLPYEIKDLFTEWLAERSEEHTSELQSRLHLVCRLLLEKKKNI